MVTDVAFLLFLQTAAGSTLMLRALRRYPMMPKFYRVNGLIVLALALLAALSAPWRGRNLVATAVAATGSSGHIPLSFPMGVLLGATLAFVALLALYNVLLWIKEGAARGALLLAAIAGLLAVGEAGLAYSAPLLGTAPRAALAALVGDSILSSWFLGSGLIGMIVGHWYLTDSRLPWEPLETCATAFLSLAGAQAVAVTLSIPLAGEGHVLGEAFALTRFTDVFVWVRLLPGLLAPLVLAAMIRRTVQLRANMSATGLFYVAMILVACGEAFSRYLLVTEGILI